MDWLTPWLPTIVALVLLAAITVIGLSGFRIPHPAAAVVAITRAVLQLAALSLILSGILGNPLWVALGLTVMFVAAIATSARRLRIGLRGAASLAIAMFAGNLIPLTIVFATGAIEFSPRYALALGGIVIGNTMTISTLTGRMFTSSVRDHWPEVEGWLALGARPIESTRTLARNAVYTALMPSIDQTKTTGLVVLPGAFVGAIFGGASPVEAGRFQIVVLASILAAGTITAITLTKLTGGVAVRPAEEPTTRTS